MSLRIGVDTGGTFTDVCAFDDESGEVFVRKVSSTPKDPGSAIVTGVAELLEQAGDRQVTDVDFFAHGTTVGTNTLLTHGGVKTGLITTRGFRDLLELGRGRRPHMYNPQVDKPVPFVPRELRYEINERVRHTGQIEVALNEEEVREVVRELGEKGVESIAVCFLYSFIAPQHEQKVAEIIREMLPEVHVSLSSQVLPEFREYERLSTVVTNAYIAPVIFRYLSRLRGRLAADGLVAKPHVTQSNGGVIPFETAEEMPVRLVLSGPSTGVVGAAQICSAAGFPNIITFDMGGTSSDVSLVQDGSPKITTGMEFEGRPIRSPMLDIHTVGAGGGSIGWIDTGGHLRVGPESAGAFPGPACYGNGTDPAVTDANVVLRYLNPDYLLNGQMKIDREASVDALRRIGEPLGLEPEEAALGMLRVVTANMARAIRVISVQRGYDPRDYALVPFGGAGPLHASRLARELGIDTIVVPEIPGAQSALGLLMTDVKADFMRSRIIRVDPDRPEVIEEAFVELENKAEAWFNEESIQTSDRKKSRRLDLRYSGQNFELPIEIPDQLASVDTLQSVIDDFHASHERTYGYRLENTPIEIVTCRIQAIGQSKSVELTTTEHQGEDPTPALETVRQAYFDSENGYQACPVYRRELLVAGNKLSGPAVIEQMDTTTVLLPGDVCVVDALGNLVITIGNPS
ncbi:hydantoinase/oxoprolinase family protein [Flaviflexus massiliensis]|uniref:hydantoinase/oxoprolinase family protein n=1 Tax=Flaviflexus massiliensis TaxID=1522309 RepID=UPI0006D5777C|nr:hydantoinase/oxoprolinase family protein [Flaviflexus massiliensis]